MSGLHLSLAYAAAALSLATVVTAGMAIAVGQPLRQLVDRLILLTLVALVMAALSGLPIVVLGRPPADPLHLVYGLAAPLILLAGRFFRGTSSPRRRALLITLAGVALLGVVYRLFTTGSAAA